LILAVLAAVQSADFLYLQRETGLTKGNLSVTFQSLKRLAILPSKRLTGASSL